MAGRPPPNEYFTTRLRFETSGVTGFGHGTIIDADGNVRCKDCDCLLMRRRLRCDECKAAHKEHKRKGRHRA